MRDYWLTKDLLLAAGIGFILLSLVGIGLALWLPKKRSGKLLALVAVGALMAIPLYRASQEVRQQQAQAKDYKERHAKAQALFDERCKTAGEKVYRTVDNVEGVLLLNVRSRGISASVLDDPSWSDAALPNEPGQDGYIMTFLWWEQFQDKRNQRGYLNNSPSDRPGFRFVDVRDQSGAIYRYRLVLPEAREMSRALVSGPPARYAVSFTNMTDPADRQFWVAGTRVTLTDTQTNEVIGEKVWYAMEPGQGNTSGGRSPWAFALQCPSHTGWSGGSTRFFVDQILKNTFFLII